MIGDKQRLQWIGALVTSSLIVALATALGYLAVSRLRDGMEQQIAEDNRIIGENLRIVINQISQELDDSDRAIDQVQDVLENAEDHGWRGFACILDEDGKVLAHPNPKMRGATVSLETYAPTNLAGSSGKDILDLPGASSPPQIYKSSADIIAVQWLPDMMTYLCVHQPQGEIQSRLDHLTGILTRTGAVFVALAGFVTWLLVGWIVDRYEGPLEISEARSRALIQNSEAIVVIGHDDRILDANPAARKLLEFEGEPGGVIPTQLEPVRSLIESARNGDPKVEDEVEIRTSSGRPLPVAVRACEITYHDRDATYLMIHDVSEQRRARDEILEANRKLKELDRLKSDFLNTVSHELRTPLTSIKWSVESLSGLNKNWDADTFDKLLKIIRDDNQRLSNLIEQLLSFSRLDAGNLVPRFETVDLRAATDKAILELAPLAEAKDISVGLTGDRTDVRADPEQLSLLMSNLLDNAIKYSPHGAQITLSTHDDKDTGRLCITDSGIGIKADDLDSIFDRFYRSEAPEVRQEAGTGLGLAIVSGIVKSHSGEIEVDSTEGNGSTFTVTLPKA